MPPLESVQKNRRKGSTENQRNAAPRAEDIAEGVGREAIAGKEQNEAHRIEATRTTGSVWLLWPSAIQSMATSPSSAARGRAAMCAAAAMPKMSDEQDDARTPFAAGSLHGVGNSDAGINAAKDAESGEHLSIRRDAGLEDGRRKTVESKGRVTAEVAIETARHPPDASAEHAAGQEERRRIRSKTWVIWWRSSQVLSGRRIPARPDLRACGTGRGRARRGD